VLPVGNWPGHGDGVVPSLQAFDLGLLIGPIVETRPGETRFAGRPFRRRTRHRWRPSAAGPMFLLGIDAAELTMSVAP